MRTRWIISLVAAAVLLGVAAVLYKPHRSPTPTPTPQSLIPSDVQQAVDFALYYPIKLPGELEVNRSSFSATQQVVTYTINQAGQPKFYVSIQSLPPQFDYAAFKAKFLTADEFSVPAGTALVGEAGSSLISSIRTTEGSWILINTPDTNAQSLLTSTTRSFQKIP